MADLLIEIGCEDLPAGSIEALAAHLGSKLHTVLLDAELAGPPPALYATPRRIAALFPEVGARQPDTDVERKGPALAAAYDADGAPTKALAGFLRGAGATTDDVSTIETPKGSWVVLQQRKPGLALADIVGKALPGIVASMPMPRRMRWGDGDDEFLRPLVWLLAVHGSETLPLTLFGLTAGNETRGHRFHAPDEMRIDEPARYADQLTDAKVVADFAKRRALIVDQVAAAASKLDAVAVMDDELVDEVTALVEWPVALAGQFEALYLEIPDEALIQTMQENQRYFALRDRAGKLMNAFITVANVESSNPATIIDGNERVIRPRFADTMFFWEKDKARELSSYRPDLDRVLFQEKLGSVGDKVGRLELLASDIAGMIGAEPVSCSLAAALCKCDLVTAIVEELAKMQGIAGRYYASRDGQPDDIALAMEEHYFPKQAGGALPGNPIAETLALADKIDTIVGIHGQGLVPSGAKDPFALRRASLGVLRILSEGGPGGEGHDVDVAALVAASARHYAGRLEAIDEKAIIGYIMDRLRGYLIERGAPGDAIEAVLARGLSNPLDIRARLTAVESFRSSDAAVALAAASKRIGNLLRKADMTIPEAVDDTLFEESAERALAQALDKARPAIEEGFARRDYQDAMTATATLREPVDAFFEAVMVMADVPAVRANRLALLAQVEKLCSHTADLSRLDIGETDRQSA